MKKVLVVTPYFFPPETGGVPMHTYNIYQRLSETKDYEVQVITTGKKNESENIGSLKVTRLKYWFKLSNTPVNPLWLFGIKRIIKDFRPNIIMLHTPVPFISDIAALCAGKIPYTLKYHHGGSMKKGKYPVDLLLGIYDAIFLRLLLRRAKIVISASDFVAKTFLRKFVDRTLTITPGVDVKLYKPGSYKTKNQIFFLGSLNKAERYKGLEYLLNALPIVRKKIKNATLTVVSPGDFEHYYKDLCVKLGIGENVRFLGKVVGDKKIKEIQKASVVVLPSRFESCPNILLEAMACAKPIVGSNITGIPDLVQDGENGILVTPTSSEEIAAAIVAILSDQKLASKMGKNGLNKVRNGYTWEKKVFATKRVIESLLIK